MRRPLVILIALLATTGLAAGTVTLASAGGDHSSRARDGATRSHERAPGHRRGDRRDGGLHRMVVLMVTKSLAGRLGVEPAALRKAAREIGREQWAARLEAAGLSESEIAVLKACHRRGHGRDGRHRRATKSRRAARTARRGAPCDRDAARAAMKKLSAAPEPDLAALKTELAAALAAKLSLTPEKVLEATRAELVQRLDQAVALNFVTAKGRELAVACFDAPASCDLKALEREVRFHARRHHRG